MRLRSYTMLFHDSTELLTNRCWQHWSRLCYVISHDCFIFKSHVIVFSCLQSPIPVPPGEHRLQYSYWLWFSRRSPGKQASVQNYDQNLKLIGRFASVEQFWALYSHLARPSDLQSHSDFHLFKIGIKPMWEVIIFF